MSESQQVKSPSPPRASAEHLGNALSALARPLKAGGSPDIVKWAIFAVLGSAVLVLLVWILFTSMDASSAASSAATAATEAREAANEAAESVKSGGAGVKNVLDLNQNAQSSPLQGLFKSLSVAQKDLDTLKQTISDESPNGLKQKFQSLKAEVDRHLNSLEKSSGRFTGQMALVNQSVDAADSKLKTALDAINQRLERVQLIAQGDDRKETVYLVMTSSTTMPANNLSPAIDAARKDAEQKYKPAHSQFDIALKYAGNSGLLTVKDEAKFPNQVTDLKSMTFQAPPVRYVVIADIGLGDPPEGNERCIVDAVLIINPNDLQVNRIYEGAQKFLERLRKWQRFCAARHGDALLFVDQMEAQNKDRERTKGDVDDLAQSIGRLLAPRRDWPLAESE